MNKSSMDTEASMEHQTYFDKNSSNTTEKFKLQSLHINQNVQDLNSDQKAFKIFLSFIQGIDNYSMALELWESLPESSKMLFTNNSTTYQSTSKSNRIIIHSFGQHNKTKLPTLCSRPTIKKTRNTASISRKKKTKHINSIIEELTNDNNNLLESKLHSSSRIPKCNGTNFQYIHQIDHENDMELLAEQFNRLQTRLETVENLLIEPPPKYKAEDTLARKALAKNANHKSIFNIFSRKPFKIGKFFKDDHKR
ncbi:hypothetical protein Kpol_364p5 [Vanderwaltozyma polyspora DSM 70294]|uniref:Uncharacterized protein n=1 Tax=Vanderwaltozyma polyspora (strain ATCC 22028 / DSM 70294 / BCRC 21397 / CBS 2163 / NBRC 10782 / NRRL Y-8283 / UCD 57-17) TaxID=436907 RepID=A7TSC1_VANPO|nr:uncharacterized protein Kpol_364p5 [Vanderwaltozyma polyspora DSM 70294]EDO14833.1 hypothetical protein Kpol_364p5 [Vanderwaltozyma polyspora DSM 70294]